MAEECPTCGKIAPDYVKAILWYSDWKNNCGKSTQLQVFRKVGQPALFVDIPSDKLPDDISATIQLIFENKERKMTETEFPDINTEQWARDNRTNLGNPWQCLDCGKYFYTIGIRYAEAHFCQDCKEKQIARKERD